MKSTSVILFITHAEVEIDPAVPVTEWGLSGRGRIRHEAFNSFLSELGVAQIYCSAEQKAVDGAAIAARHLGKDYRVLAALHKNDRSATGYLPPAELANFQEAGSARLWRWKLFHVSTTHWHVATELDFDLTTQGGYPSTVRRVSR